MFNHNPNKRPQIFTSSSQSSAQSQLYGHKQPSSSSHNQQSTSATIPSAYTAYPSQTLQSPSASHHQPYPSTYPPTQQPQPSHYQPPHLQPYASTPKPQTHPTQQPTATPSNKPVLQHPTTTSNSLNNTTSNNNTNTSNNNNNQHTPQTPFQQFSEAFVRIHNASNIEWRQTKLLAEAVGVDGSKINSAKRDAMMKDMVALVFAAIVCDKKLIDVSRNTTAWQKIFEFKHFEGKALQSVEADPSQYFYEENGKIVISRGWLRSKKIIKTKYENRFQLSKLWRDACLCGRAAQQNQNVVSCQVAGCGKRYHRKCVGWVGQPSAVFECPKCALQGQDPLHDVIEVLVEPSMLVRKTEYNFTLTDDQRVRFKEKKNLAVEIRCMKLRYQHYYEHSWPELIRVSLNNSVIVDVRPTDDEKRKDSKPFLRKNLVVGRNLLKVEFKDPDEQDRRDRVGKFIIGIFIVQKLVSKELSERIIADNRVTPAQTSIFLQKLAQEYGKDLGVEEFTCDLQCKLTMKSMSIPARGLYCTHLQCFSLDSFLSLQSTRPVREWYCQICHKPSHRMIFDEFFLTMISRARDERSKTGKNFNKFSVNSKMEYKLLASEDLEKQEATANNLEERCIAESKNEAEKSIIQGEEPRRASSYHDQSKFGTGADIEYSSDEEGELAGFGEGPQPAAGAGEDHDEGDQAPNSSTSKDGSTPLLKQAIIESNNIAAQNNAPNSGDTKGDCKIGKQKNFITDPNPVITPRGRPRKQGIPKNLGKRFESDDDEECGVTQDHEGHGAGGSGSSKQGTPVYPQLLKDFPRYEDMRRQAVANGVGVEKKQIPWLLPAHTVVPRPGGNLNTLEEKLRKSIIVNDLDAQGNSIESLSQQYMAMLNSASLFSGGSTDGLALLL